MPRRAFGLLLAGMLSGGAAAACIFFIDPEVRLARAIVHRKRAWAQRCHARFPSKVVVYGGSSCAFSLDGERLEQRFGLPTVNMAMGAGLGAGMLTRIALGAVREGDTLVVALELGLLTRPFTRVMAAAHLAYALGEPALLEDPTSPATGWPRLGDIFSLRPDAPRTCALLGKVLLRQPLFRYRLEEVEPSGYQWTNVRMPFGGPPEQDAQLSADARRVLDFLRRYTATHRVALYYSLPWVFGPPAAAGKRRRENIALIREIREFMPVLRDPALGVQTDPALFADTSHHLSREAAMVRTDELGEQLTQRLIWDEASLAAAEK